jgi:hypothetical protein
MAINEKDDTPLFVGALSDKKKTNSEAIVSLSFEFEDASSSRNQPQLPYDHAGSSIIGSIINLTNTIVGSGILALPFAFASSGMLLGTTFLFLFSSASGFGLHLLAVSAFKVETKNAFFKKDLDQHSFL